MGASGAKGVHNAPDDNGLFLEFCQFATVAAVATVVPVQAKAKSASAAMGTFSEPYVQAKRTYDETIKNQHQNVIWWEQSLQEKQYDAAVGHDPDDIIHVLTSFHDKLLSDAKTQCEGHSLNSISSPQLVQ